MVGVEMFATSTDLEKEFPRRMRDAHSNEILKSAQQLKGGWRRAAGDGRRATGEKR
jgi:hypothetical protein